MMPTSREGFKDFKMSLAISSKVVPLPGLSLGSTYSPGAHSSDAPKRQRGFLRSKLDNHLLAFQK